MHVPAELDAYLRLLAGPYDGRTGRWFDIRWPSQRDPRFMDRRFVSAHDLSKAARVIVDTATKTHVFMGVALHDRQAGDNTSVSLSHLAWADLDHDNAPAALDAFPHAPTMIIASGSGRHRHAYWLLDAFYPINEIMVANRKIAGALDGDLMMGQSRVSMLRPPATLNYKQVPPKPVRTLSIAGRNRYELSVLTAGLEDPKPPLTPRPRPARALESHPLYASAQDAHHALRTTDARIWMPRLTGVELVADDRMCCPFHEDNTPSLKAYPSGWWQCYGCGARGDMIEFACRLWDRPNQGNSFVEVRADLARMFLGQDLTTPTARPTPIPA